MADDEDLVMATLDKYAGAYCDKDIDSLMGIFVSGERISLIGTGQDELCFGRSAVRAIFERNFREATVTQFEWGWRHIAVHNGAATVAIALTIHLVTDSGTMLLPVRWTVSLVETSDGWKWVHRHASVAASSQDEGSAYPSVKQ